MIRNHIKTIVRDSGINFDRAKYLRLDANERAIPFSKKLLLSLKKNITSDVVQSYSMNQKKVLQLISKYEKINSKYISCFPGTSFALKYIFESLSYKENKILSFYPTYGMIDIYSKIYKLKIVRVPEKKILKFLKEKTIKNSAFIYFANPNQPSGNLVPYHQMIRILKIINKYKKIIVIDEAYIDFSSQKSLAPLVKKFKNLIILKTLSKCIGIAGLRFSYMLSNPNLSSVMNVYRPPQDISHFSIKIAEFFLKNKKIFKKYLLEIKRSKKFVKSECEKNNFDLKETNVNFFYISFKKKKTTKIVIFLKKKKILVKHLNGIPNFANSIRVTYGSIKQMRIFFNILKQAKKIS